TPEMLIRLGWWSGELQAGSLHYGSFGPGRTLKRACLEQLTHGQLKSWQHRTAVQGIVLSQRLAVILGCVNADDSFFRIYVPHEFDTRREVLFEFSFHLAARVGEADDFDRETRHPVRHWRRRIGIHRY